MDHDRDLTAQDEALLAALRRVVGVVDPVPEETLLAARSAFAYHRLDAAYAELTFDSTTEDKELAGVRSAQTASRQLSFQAGTLLIEVEVEAEGTQRRLVGQCIPGGPVDIVIRQPDAEHTTSTDDLGRFTASVSAGPVSLRCSWPMTDQVVETAWVVI